MNVQPIIDKENIEITDSLNELLANEFGLFTKTLNFHWNITGARFHSLHTFLEKQYKELLPLMDSVAERIRTLGERPLSTVKKFSEKMTLDEINGKNLSSNEMIMNLYEDNVKIQTLIKEVLTKEHLFKKDPGTEDFLVGILQKHEFMSWTLKSHLD